MKNISILIAGGGTGGHIYPGLAIAEALKRQAAARNQKVEVEFVGTPQGLESKIVPAQGYKLHLIQSGKLNLSGRVREKIATLLKLPLGLLQSLWILIKLRPSYVIGVGGYASAPMLFAAWVMRKRTAIWEPNAHPGMANRLLARFVSKAFVVFDEAKKYIACSQIIKSGMPLREEIELAREHREQIEKREKTELSEIELREQKESELRAQKPFTLLCFGGSQGSVFLNTQLCDFVLKNPPSADFRVIHQTGRADFARIKEKYNGRPDVEVLEYIFEMPKYLAQADALFCRGGASTLAEASAFALIPIIVPLPAADNHQQHNAESVVRTGAGFMILQDQFSQDEFAKAIHLLKTDAQKKRQMQKALSQLVPARSADKIASNLLSEIL